MGLIALALILPYLEFKLSVLVSEVGLIHSLHSAQCCSASEEEQQYQRNIDVTGHLHNVDTIRTQVWNLHPKAILIHCQAAVSDGMKSARKLS